MFRDPFRPPKGNTKGNNNGEMRCVVFSVPPIKVKNDKSKKRKTRCSFFMFPPEMEKVREHVGGMEMFLFPFPQIHGNLKEQVWERKKFRFPVFSECENHLENVWEIICSLFIALQPNGNIKYN